MDQQPEDQHEPAEPTQHQTGPTGRGGDGRFTRTLETAQRDARAAQLRSDGWSYRKIAAELGVDVATAHAAVQRALKATVEEPAAEVRALEIERLDQLYEATVQVLRREHVTVSQGRVVRARVLNENGSPIVIGHEDDGTPIFREQEILDDGPTLKAVEVALKIQARRAALLGLDAERKVDVGGQLTYEIIGVNPEDL